MSTIYAFGPIPRTCHASEPYGLPRFKHARPNIFGMQGWKGLGTSLVPAE